MLFENGMKTILEQKKLHLTPELNTADSHDNQIKRKMLDLISGISLQQ